MRLQIVEHAKAVLESYWFIPLVCSVGAAALVYAAGWLDALAAAGRIPELAYFRGATSAGARAILATIAGSSISVAGVVFSISMVVLTTASTQLGPRLLPNFFRRKSTQTVLGGFMATFITALLVLVEMTDEAGAAGAQSYALGLSVLLAVLSFALLVYFLQSMTSFIQVPRVIDEVGCDLARLLERETVVDPGAADGDGEREAAALAARCGEDAAEVRAERGGYVQALDSEAALRLASEKNIFVQMLRRPGQYAAAGDTLARVAPASAVDGELAGDLRRLFVIGVQRTNSQDIEFALDQLVEIAVRALSPGINDPFTAINCIDRLGDALSILAVRRLRPDVCRDEGGQARVLLVGYTDEGVFDAAFNQLRQHGCGDVAVSIRLMEVIARITRGGARDRARRALTEHLERVHDACRRETPGAADLRDIDARYREAAAAMH